MFLAAATHMPGRTHTGPLLPLTAGETAAMQRLREHVVALAETIGERNVWRPANLNAAARHIEGAFTDLGLTSVAQEYDCRGMSVRNLVVEIPGKDRAEEIVLVGAHYDSVMGSPGANDNGSGIAALLEIARHFRSGSPSRTLRFVAFVNEEPPFFQTADMGSRVYAKAARERGDRIVAMLSLETIGCYSDRTRSQKYPFPMAPFYPHTGNFVAFVGNLASRRLVRSAITTFRGQTPFPSEGASLPGWITGVGWSDHWSFWKEDYPAIMVTDTALFRYAHYHAFSDTPDRIDYARLARVTTGLTHVVTALTHPSGDSPDH